MFSRMDRPRGNGGVWTTLVRGQSFRGPKFGGQPRSKTDRSAHLVEPSLWIMQADVSARARACPTIQETNSRPTAYAVYTPPMTIYRVRLSATGWQGGPSLNTFYFKRPSPQIGSEQSDAQNMSDRVQAAFTTGKDLYPNIWVGRVDPEVAVINEVNGQITNVLTTTPQLPITGTGTAGFNALATGILLQMRTNVFLNGRRLRGRAFLSPIGPRNEADGSPDAGGIGVAQSIGDALLSAGGTLNVLVVWHRPKFSVPKTIPPTVVRNGSEATVQSITVPNKFVIMRSRRD